MANVTGRLEGAEDLLKVLKLLPKKVADQALANAVRAGANVIRKEVKRRAPVGRGQPNLKYGRLRDNIKVTRATKAVSPGEVAMIVHTGKAFWGRFFEFGNSRQPARPFMRPALDEAARPAFEMLAKRLKKNIEKLADELTGARKLSKTTRRRL